MNNNIPGVDVMDTAIIHGYPTLVEGITNVEQMKPFMVYTDNEMDTTCISSMDILPPMEYAVISRQMDRDVDYLRKLKDSLLDISGVIDVVFRVKEFTSIKQGEVLNLWDSKIDVSPIPHLLVFTTVVLELNELEELFHMYDNTIYKTMTIKDILTNNILSIDDIWYKQLESRITKILESDIHLEV